MKPVTDPVGARTYSPSEEACRKAPALVCAVASRVLRVREAIRLGKPWKIEDITAPLPFEEDLLSGKIDRVDRAFSQFKTCAGSFIDGLRYSFKPQTK